MFRVGGAAEAAAAGAAAAAVLSKRHESVDSLTQRLVTGDDIDQTAYWLIVDVIKRIPEREKEKVLSQALRLIPSNVCGYMRESILKTVSSLPEEEREQIITQALRLIQDWDAGLWRNLILYNIKAFPKEDREAVVTQVLRISTPQMSASTARRFLSDIQDLRISTEKLEQVVTQALPIITEQVGEIARIHIVTSLATLPTTEDREHATDLTSLPGFS